MDIGLPHKQSQECRDWPSTSFQHQSDLGLCAQLPPVYSLPVVKLRAIRFQSYKGYLYGLLLLFLLLIKYHKWERGQSSQQEMWQSQVESVGVWKMWPVRCLLIFKEGIQWESKGLTDNGLLPAHDPVARRTGLSFAWVFVFSH